jgi:hypothetical protein
MLDIRAHKRETQNINHTPTAPLQAVRGLQQGHKLLAAGLQCFWI